MGATTLKNVLGHALQALAIAGETSFMTNFETFSDKFREPCFRRAGCPDPFIPPLCMLIKMSMEYCNVFRSLCYEINRRSCVF